jgi:hypothetical protein
MIDLAAMQCRGWAVFGASLVPGSEPNMDRADALADVPREDQRDNHDDTKNTTLRQSSAGSCVVLVVSLC